MLAKYESLYLAILRATDPDPERRFSSMEEMADQLTGVLHEIAAVDTQRRAAADVELLQPAARGVRRGPERAGGRQRT